METPENEIKRWECGHECEEMEESGLTHPLFLDEVQDGRHDDRLDE
jgi:hypothetical protein